jgi:hypothetical protein
LGYRFLSVFILLQAAVAIWGDTGRLQVLKEMDSQIVSVDLNTGARALRLGGAHKIVGYNSYYDAFPNFIILQEQDALVVFDVGRDSEHAIAGIKISQDSMVTVMPSITEKPVFLICVYKVLSKANDIKWNLKYVDSYRFDAEMNLVTKSGVAEAVFTNDRLTYVYDSKHSRLFGYFSAASWHSIPLDEYGLDGRRRGTLVGFEDFGIKTTEGHENEQQGRFAVFVSNGIISVVPNSSKDLRSIVLVDPKDSIQKKTLRIPRDLLTKADIEGYTPPYSVAYEPRRSLIVVGAQNGVYKVSIGKSNIITNFELYKRNNLNAYIILITNETLVFQSRMIVNVMNLDTMRVEKEIKYSEPQKDGDLIGFASGAEAVR